MASDTPLSARNLVIYEIYVRNHTPEGTFTALEAELPRLKSMGVDVIWLMPIHPIGQLNRKGSLGSPYSIQDYRSVNPEYGTMDDFRNLVEVAHSLGLQVWIDVVFNHTSHDSILVQQYPHFFHQDANAVPVTTVPEWEDIIDLSHPDPALTRYLIDSLLLWSRLGVDGFRCDVASYIPVEFWLEARREVARVNPHTLWLAESTDVQFTTRRRMQGLPSASDGELFAAFDILYQYEIWPVLQRAVQGKVPIAHLLDLLRFQEVIYPFNYTKLRFVENHDNWRIMRLAPSREQALAWTAFMAFCKGPFLIYSGQETGTTHLPSLFDIDKIPWNDRPLQDFLTRLAQLKKHPAQLEGQFVIPHAEPVIQAAWQLPDTATSGLYGLFNVANHRHPVAVPLPDGDYPDLLNGGSVLVQRSQLYLATPAAILSTGFLPALKHYSSELMDLYQPQ